MSDMQWVADAVRYFLADWGYLAVIVGILGEDAGLRLPSETVLISAGFLARKGTRIARRRSKTLPGCMIYLKILPLGA